MRVTIEQFKDALYAAEQLYKMFQHLNASDFTSFVLGATYGATIALARM